MKIVSLSGSVHRDGASQAAGVIRLIRIRGNSRCRRACGGPRTGGGRGSGRDDAACDAQVVVVGGTKDIESGPYLDVECARSIGVPHDARSGVNSPIVVVGDLRATVGPVKVQHGVRLRSQVARLDGVTGAHSGSEFNPVSVGHGVESMCLCWTIHGERACLSTGVIGFVGIAGNAGRSARRGPGRCTSRCMRRGPGQCAGGCARWGTGDCGRGVQNGRVLGILCHVLPHGSIYTIP